MLLFRRVNINSRFSDTIRLCGGQHKNLSTLHFAAGNDHDSMVEFLIDRGANINSKDCMGWNPLHMAAARVCTSAVKALLGRGVALEDVACLTGGEMAFMNLVPGKREITKKPVLLDRLGLAKKEVAYNVRKCTPLYLAAVFGFLETVQVLIDTKQTKASKWSREG